MTGEAPLIATTTSSVGGNVDPKQIQELPANGRNWIGLALLAPGSRTAPTIQTPSAGPQQRRGREFQLNLDGQQISSELGTATSPDSVPIRSQSSSSSRTVDATQAGPRA